MPIKQSDPKIDSLITKQMRQAKSPYGEVANNIYNILSKATFTDKEFAQLLKMFNAPKSVIKLAIEIKSLPKDQYKLLSNLIHLNYEQLNAIHDYHQLVIDMMSGKVFDKPNSTKSVNNALIKYAAEQKQTITAKFAQLIYDNTSCYLHGYAQPAISLDILKSVIVKKLPYTEESVNKIITEIQRKDSAKLNKAIKEEIKQTKPVVDQNNQPINLDKKTPDSEDPFK